MALAPDVPGSPRLAELGGRRVPTTQQTSESPPRARGHRRPGDADAHVVGPFGGTRGYATEADHFESVYEASEAAEAVCALHVERLEHERNRDPVCAKPLEETHETATIPVDRREGTHVRHDDHTRKGLGHEDYASGDPPPEGSRVSLRESESRER